jgi:hypothetical protein
VKRLDPVTKGPSGIVRVFNRIISWANGMKLIQGAGIYITPTDEGWIISTVPPSSEADGTTTGGSGGSSLLAGATWTSIDVMDSSCVRSTIQVLTKPASS